MKTKTCLFLFVALFCFTSSNAQDLDRYQENADRADSLYRKKNFPASAEKYREAFMVFEGKAYPKDRYNAACSYALAGNADTAFYHLFRLARDSKYNACDQLAHDTDLVSLHSDTRWNELVAIVSVNKVEAEKNIDPVLVAILDTVYRDDQQTRQQKEETAGKYGWQSPEVRALGQTMREKDSINQLKVTKILDERGWLGADIVGEQGNRTLFLVIQHAGQKTQEKYLPMMREAVKKNNANAHSLALLEDRVALGQGKKQLYGSQIMQDPETGQFYVMPLEDPDNVDKRRKEVGLGPMQDYVAMWGLTWDPEAYKKQLPEIEEKRKRQE